MKKVNYLLILISWVVLSVRCSEIKNETDKEKANIDEHFVQSTAPDSSHDTKLEALRLCTELLPPPAPKFHIPVESDTSVYYRDFKTNDTLIQHSFTPTQAYIASLTSYTWRGTPNLKVQFLDGDPVVIEKVKNVAREWERHCGVRFNFGSFPDPDITISFRYQGSWSYIGSYSRQTRPSMNFGWLYRDTPSEEYYRVVLHEFGHALGFVHEQQNPNGDIQWDKEKVYQYYMGPPNNWDKPTADRNIFQKYDRNQVNATAFDSLSIMLYAIPAYLTANGYSTEFNSQLSNLDKNLAISIYPKPIGTTK